MKKFMLTNNCYIDIYVIWGKNGLGGEADLT